MKRYNQFLLCCLLFAIALGCCVPLLQMRLNIYDEGIILAGADRVQRGDVPYRDFWSMYPPGQFYTVALLFKLFGSSVVVERVYDLTIRALLAVCGFLITNKLSGSNKVGIISWGMVLAWTVDSRFSGYPVYVALLLILVGILFFLHYLEKRQARWLFYCGLMMALGAAFRHDLAGMAALVILSALFAPKMGGARARLRSIGAYFGGMALVGLPLAIYFLAVVGLGPVIEQLIFTPAEVMPKYRWLPYPPFVLFETIHFYLFPLISGVALLLSLILVLKKVHTKVGYGIFVLSLMGILFMNQVRIRSDTIHLFPTALMSLIVLPNLLSLRLLRSTQAVKVAAAVSGAVIAVLFVGFVLEKAQARNEPYFARPTRSVLERAGYAPTDRNLVDVVSFIQDNTTADEAIYVGVTNHDQFLINNVMLYFLIGRPYGTRYHELHPGVTTTLYVQQEIVEELKNAPVKLIILHEGYWHEPNQTAVDLQVDLLDQYILANYRMVKKFGGYQVWSGGP